jgi:hypothetical protein
VEANLDLRFNGKLIPEISLLFNKIAHERRNHFNELISVLSLPHKTNLDWWVQGPASRNTLACPFFHHYCCVYLVDHLVEKGGFEFEEILVGSPVFGELIESFLGDRGVKHCVVRCEKDVITIAKKEIKKYLLIPVLFFKKLFQFVVARLTRKSSLKLNSAKPIVLIDTYVIPGYVGPERWYGNLWGNLTDEMREETFFVPTIVMASLWSMFSIYNILRLDSRKYLIKEDLLEVGDIVYAFRHGQRLKEVPIKPLSIFGYDISKLVREELETNSDFLTVIESILTYRFIGRLRQSGAKVRLAIDWFEGQVIDKAWNMGLKEYFPEAKRIGCRPFESFPLFLCAYPISIERDAEVIPDVMAVQGRGTVSTVREFLPDLDVMVIPSFKSGFVWEFDKPKSVRGNFTVLVALPISISMSARMISRLSEVHSSIDLQDKAIGYIFKPHPTVSIEKIMSELQISIPDVFLFSEEKSFPKMLARADLLITECSSVCLEAMACGIPVVVIENYEGLTYDPIPKDTPSHLYARAHTKEQLADGIKHFATLPPEGLERLKVDGDKIREEYFEPITKEGVERLMDIVREKV